MGKLKVRPQEVRQPLARVGGTARWEGGQGQDAASGATLLKMNAQSERCENRGMRVGWRGAPEAKGKGAF